LFEASNMNRAKKGQRFLNLTNAEASAVQSMFKLYDIKATGYITAHLALKLIRSLGFDVHLQQLSLGADVTIGELLNAIDEIMPPSEPMVNSSLTTFNGLVSKKQRNNNSVNNNSNRLLSSVDEWQSGATTADTVITPTDICDFMESLGRPAIPMSEAASLLSSMLQYDDCSTDPAISNEVFTKELLIFAKKTNALKDFR